MEISVDRIEIRIRNDMMRICAANSMGEYIYLCVVQWHRKKKRRKKNGLTAIDMRKSKCLQTTLHTLQKTTTDRNGRFCIHSLARFELVLLVRSFVHFVYHHCAGICLQCLQCLYDLLFILFGTHHAQFRHTFVVIVVFVLVAKILNQTSCTDPWSVQFGHHGLDSVYLQLYKYACTKCRCQYRRRD